MPRQQPIQSYLHIRDYAEKWQWTDPRTGQHMIGFNPPPEATDASPHPFNLKALTIHGESIDEEAICISVDTALHLRTVRVKSRPYPIDIYDMFIIEIDGVRFQNH